MQLPSNKLLSALPSTANEADNVLLSMGSKSAELCFVARRLAMFTLSFAEQSKINVEQSRNSENRNMLHESNTHSPIIDT